MTFGKRRDSPAGFDSRATQDALHARLMQEQHTHMSRFQSTDDRRVENNTLRHQYRTLSDEEKDAMRAVKDAGAEFLTTLDACLPLSREHSIARTKIEEAVMWAVKGITS